MSVFQCKSSIISYCIGVVVAKKVKVRIALYGQIHDRAMERQWSPAIWDHTVLPDTRHRWARPALTPAMHAGTRGAEGWVYLVTRKRSHRESNSRPLGPESNALTTEPPSNSKCYSNSNVERTLQIHAECIGRFKQDNALRSADQHQEIIHNLHHVNHSTGNCRQQDITTSPAQRGHSPVSSHHQIPRLFPDYCRHFKWIFTEYWPSQQ